MPAFGDVEQINEKIRMMTRMVEDLASIAMHHKLHPLMFVRKHFSITLGASKLHQLKTQVGLQAVELDKTLDTANIYYASRWPFMFP